MNIHRVLRTAGRLLRMRTGQSSLEFVILCAAVLMFFLLFLAAISEQQGARAFEQREFLVKDTALQVQQELVLAANARDGYERTFELPHELLNHAYTVTLAGNLVQVQTVDGKHSLALAVPTVNGTIVVGKNMVRKINGTIVVSG